MLTIKAALGEDRAAQETQPNNSLYSTRDPLRAAIEVVERAIESLGLISLARDRREREQWAARGLTLRQRDRAVRWLVQWRGYEFVVDDQGRMYVRRGERDRA